MKTKLKKYIQTRLLGDLTVPSSPGVGASRHSRRECIDWIYDDLVGLAEEFVRENNLCDTAFAKIMNSSFNTEKSGVLMRKWAGEYLAKILVVMDDFAHPDTDKAARLTLEDNPINRFAYRKISSKFKADPRVRWVKQAGIAGRFGVVLFQFLFIVYLSLESGITFFRKKKRYKVMRESLWGLYSKNGYYLHDDFLVDGKMIKIEDMLIFARKDMAACQERREAYEDAKRSKISTFYLPELKIGAESLIFRIAPLYMRDRVGALFSEIRSPNFSFFSSVNRWFIYNAIPYEKIFSNYEVGSELGHCFFSSRHVVEAIICQSVGSRYYLMHWADHARKSTTHIVSFLGCDKYLSWGSAHIKGVEGPPEMVTFTGCTFKRFIRDVASRRKDVLSEMGIISSGHVVSFFDEPTDNAFTYTVPESVGFWEDALEFAMKEPDVTVIMKPKELSRFDNLRGDLKGRFSSIINRIRKLGNVHIVDAKKWSFIECIGVSDIVITEGVASSATIAIVCGIEGLYMNKARLDHPFARVLKDKVVFDKSDKLFAMAREILAGKVSALGMIPEDLIRKFDAYPDDRGIDMLRSALTGER